MHSFSLIAVIALPLLPFMAGALVRRQSGGQAGALAHGFSGAAFLAALAASAAFFSRAPSRRGGLRRSRPRLSP
jgi:hypothetical protein